MSDPDDMLVHRVLSGQTDGFRGLVERYKDAVYGVALSKTGSFADAEDIAQDTFLAAFESLSSLKDPARFGAWLYRIAVHKASMHVRKQRQLRRTNECYQANAAGAARAQNTRPEGAQDAVLAALARLSESNRRTATLYYVNGYSQVEISRFTSCPLGTIKRRLHDARRWLRKEMIAMVEDELKSSRPGPQFSERVLRRIRQVRVWPGGEKQGFLMLTDSKKRSFMIIIGPPEAKALRPWLAGRGSPDGPDMYTALVRTLKRFDARIEKAAVSRLEDTIFYADLEVRSNGRTVMLDCRPSDAVNLAARAGAALHVDCEVADRCMMKRPDGRPMSPAEAARRVERTAAARGKPVKHAASKIPFPFKTAAEVVQALESNPEIADARFALHLVALVSTGEQVLLDPKKGFELKLKDAGETAGRLRAWLERVRGTEREAAVSGLLGAFHMSSRRGADAKSALPYLEIALRRAPADKRIAFDLAAAYAIAGRADDAFGVLGRHKFQEATWCKAFSVLWDDPRFKTTIGEPQPNAAFHFVSWQLTRPPLTLGARSGEPLFTRAVKPMTELSDARLQELEELLGRRPLRRVLQVSCITLKDGGRAALLLRVEPDRAAMTAVAEVDVGRIRMASKETPAARPMAHDTFCNALAAAKVDLEAVVLLKPRGTRLAAALIARKANRREVIHLDGAAAVAAAVAWPCPISIADRLAEKLCVRCRSRGPLSFKDAKEEVELKAHTPEPPVIQVQRVKR